YASHPLAVATTLAVEAGVNKSPRGPRASRGGGSGSLGHCHTGPKDFQTNAALPAAPIKTHTPHLRPYTPAPSRGLLPGGREPRLVLYDLRRGEVREITPDDAAVEEHVRRAAQRIGAGDFALRPEHDQRPCRLCAYRPICPSARKVL